MFATTKTTTKVLGGFGFAIVIALIVGFVGYRGIHKLSTNVQEIGMVRLPSVESLLVMNEAQTAVKAAERTLGSSEIGRRLAGSTSSAIPGSEETRR